MEAEMGGFLDLSGLRTVFELGFDRAMFVLAVICALLIATWLGIWMEHLYLAPIPTGI